MKCIGNAKQSNYKTNREMELKLAHSVKDCVFSIPPFDLTVKGVSIEKQIAYVLVDVTNTDSKGKALFPKYKTEAFQNGVALERVYSLSSHAVYEKIRAGETYSHKAAFEFQSIDTPIEVKISMINPYNNDIKILCEKTFEI